MEQVSKFIGLDVHKATIAVAVAMAAVGRTESLGAITNEPDAVVKLGPVTDTLWAEYPDQPAERRLRR